MSDDNKWDFTKPDPQEDSPEAKERKGMTVLLIAGIIFLIGGLWCSWKIGALDYESFFGDGARYRHRSIYSNQGSGIGFVWMMFNSPWLLGCAMIWAALSHFFSKRKK